MAHVLVVDDQARFRRSLKLVLQSAVDNLSLDQRALLHRINANAQQMSNLVSNLLDAELIERGTFRYILGRVLREKTLFGGDLEISERQRVEGCRSHRLPLITASAPSDTLPHLVRITIHSAVPHLCISLLADSALTESLMACESKSLVTVTIPAMKRANRFLRGVDLS